MERPPPAAPDAGPATEALIDRMQRDGRAAWPGLDAPSYGAFVRARWPVPVERAADLFLACACAAGDRAAHARFDATYRPLIERAARRLIDEPAAAHDVAQQVLAATLLGPTARIASYSGRGPLASWIAVVASRLGVDAMRRAGRAEQRARRVTQWAESPAEDAELAYLRRTYRDALERALERALTELSTRARLLLRYRAVEGLSQDAIAGLYGVHRVTVARWLARAREELMRRTRQHLIRETGLRESEVDSVHRLVASQLDISLARLLGAASD